MRMRAPGSEVYARRAGTALAAAVTAVALGAGAAGAEPPDLKSKSPDETLSPYFVVEGEGEATEMLPLESTRADVRISGVIAHVDVKQVYRNTGDEPIEAVYVFPGSTRAAVFGMRMTIGDRTIRATINEKEKAREMYEKAKEAGKSASLLEQERPNVFRMSVANIMPGDRIEVDMDYTELLVPEEGVYEFVYPSVVGPRFSKTSEEEATLEDSWVANPFLRAGEEPPYEWSVDVEVDAGMPLAELQSPSHEVESSFEGERRATVSTTDEAGGDRDFVLRYRLAGGRIESGLLLYPGQESPDHEKYFLAMVQPPKRVEPEAIPPREYVFVLDVSGSMRGFPLNTAKTLMEDLLGELRPQDRFNVVTFAGGAGTMSERSVEATESNIQRGLSYVGQQRGGGGTRLLQGLKKGFGMPSAEGTSRSMVVITDGYISFEAEAFELIRDELGEANLFSFGIGSSVNRHLIEGMASAGQGKPFVVREPDEAAERAERFRRYVEAPVLTDVGVRFDGFEAYDVEPNAIPDVFASRPVLVYGKYEGEAEGRIRLSGRTGRGRWSRTLEVGDYEPRASNRALEHLWARRRIALLGDLQELSADSARAEAITELGLRHSLMTDYTSFVAVDDRVRNDEGDPETVKQPLPMPKGVPNSAVGQAKQKMQRAAPSRAPSPERSRSGSGSGGVRGKAARNQAIGELAEDEDVELEQAEEEVDELEERKEERKVVALELELRVDGADGPRSAADVERALDRALDGLDGCLEPGSDGPGGTVRVELELGAKGGVDAVRITDHEDVSGSIRSCFESRLGSLELDLPRARGTTTVRLELSAVTK